MLRLFLHIRRFRHSDFRHLTNKVKVSGNEPRINAADNFSASSDEKSFMFLLPSRDTPASCRLVVFPSLNFNRDIFVKVFSTLQFSAVRARTRSNIERFSFFIFIKIILKLKSGFHPPGRTGGRELNIFTRFLILRSY